MSEVLLYLRAQGVLLPSVPFNLLPVHFRTGGGNTKPPNFSTSISSHIVWRNLPFSCLQSGLKSLSAKIERHATEAQ